MDLKNIIGIVILILFFIPVSYGQNYESSKNKKTEKMHKSNQEWKKILSPMQYFVTRENGTERPFTGKYDEFFEKGIYVCVCCKLELFDKC